MIADDEILRIEELRASYMGRSTELKVVDGLDLSIRRGEIIGIAGESGSGKTTLVSAVLRLLRPPGRIQGGRVWFRPDPRREPIDLLAVDEGALRQLRWATFSYVPQSSMNVLNPVATVGRQMVDTMLQHGLERAEAERRIDDALRLVSLPAATAQSFPHELSGGMRQRVVIAAAITMRPALIVADEPTTALDVNVQRQILQSLARIRRQLGTTVVLVSHDMAALAQLVDRLAIMYAGQVVEAGDVVSVFDAALHPYAQRLISSIPSLSDRRRRIEGIPGLAPSPRAWPTGCRFHPRCGQAMPICQAQPPELTTRPSGHRVSCHLYGTGAPVPADPDERRRPPAPIEALMPARADARPAPNGRGDGAAAPLIEARNVGKVFVSGGLFSHRQTVAVDGVDLVFPGDRPRIISLVGESGSGKTTLARMVLGLTRPSSGTVCYQGRDLAGLSRDQRRRFRREVQAVFQDPYGIYNPFYPVDRVMRMVVRKFGLAATGAAEATLIEEALRAVDLRAREVLGRYPHQLSGGERQRVMLARLFLLKPRLIVADEPVSMIDAAVRAMFLNILLDFRDRLGISTLFITHNLATANYLGGEIMVLYRGRVAERGQIDPIIREPKHPYTRVLLESVPLPDPRRRWSEEATLIGVESGDRPGRARCLFAERCAHVSSACLAGRPPELALPDGRAVACTLYAGDGRSVPRPS
jgi:peptide/nickel transport system ATP-binding protein